MSIKHRILDLLFPRICPLCGGILSLTEELLCLECLLSLPRTKYHECPYDNDVKNLFELQIPVERAVSFMRYMPGTDSSKLIKATKYRSGKSMAFMFGKMVAQEYVDAGSRFFDDIDVIVPVPLTPGRKNARGFNQSEAIAKGVSAVTGISVDAKSVRRLRFLKSQTALRKDERLENVDGVFRCVAPQSLAGKHILLLDDIVTTGATLLSLADSIRQKTENVTFSVLTMGITGEMKM